MKNIKNMTLSTKRKILTVTGLPIAAALLVVGFQNCSPGVVQSSRQASVGTASLNTNIDEDTKPITTTYSENTLLSMQAQTGIAMPSARTIAAANSAKAKMGETGKVDAVNAPALMAITNVAGEICLDLVTEEKAKAADARRIFNQVNFATSPAAQTATAKADLIRRMARNFWSRNETPAEKTVLLTSIDGAIADGKRTGVTDAIDTEDMMVFTCTGMLASMDAFAFK